MKLNPDKDIPTFISQFEEIYRKVKDAMEEVRKDYRCCQIIQNLPEEYDYLVREFDSWTHGPETFILCRSLAEGGEKKVQDSVLS